MINAPEKIWAHPTERKPVPAHLRSNAAWVRGKWKDHNSNAHGDMGYIREDIHDVVVVERDAHASISQERFEQINTLIAENKRLRGELIDTLAETIYLRAYGKDGAIWSSNETKDVWRDMARDRIGG